MNEMVYAALFGGLIGLGAALVLLRRPNPPVYFMGAVESQEPPIVGCLPVVLVGIIVLVLITMFQT
jgi:hypothetical protein